MQGRPGSCMGLAGTHEKGRALRWCAAGSCGSTSRMRPLLAFLCTTRSVCQPCKPQRRMYDHGGAHWMQHSHSADGVLHADYVPQRCIGAGSRVVVKHR